MNSLELAHEIVDTFIKKNVRRFCVCAGGRNVSLLEVLSKDKSIEVRSFYNENSAGFYALGWAKRAEEPVCVVTTSGSAVGELLPSFLESYYSDTPLVLLTADRPKSFRGTGSPQTIEQAGIFSSFSKRNFDIENLKDLRGLKEIPSLIGAHINVCFSEPLLNDKTVLADSEGGQSLENGDQTLEKIDKPLIILSGLSKSDAKKLKGWFSKTHLPFYVEAHSNMHSDLLHHPSRIFSLDAQLNYFESKIKSIIRLGGVPTTKLWRDLEKIQMKVKNYSNQSFTGLTYVRELNSSIDDFLSLDPKKMFGWSMEELKQLKNQSDKMTNKLEDMVLKYPKSDLALARTVLNFASGKNLFLGNSSPIRYADLALSHHNQFEEVFTSRGTNGIDGLVSQSVGLVDQKSKLVSFIGDLTALYDLSGFWPFHGFKKHLKSQMTTVILNNYGGELFRHVFTNNQISEKAKNYLQVPHGLSFKKMADFWDLPYQKICEVDEFEEQSGIIELLPCPEQSQLFWNELRD